MRFGMLLLLGVLLLAADAREVRAQVAEENGSGEQFAVDEALARRGQALFRNKGCTACHTVGRGRGAGPDLLGVTERRDLDWVRQFIKDPASMLDSDPIAMELLQEFRGARMPNMRMTDAEVEAIVHYLAKETERRR
jgi:mono/diheme cytochrome c family protein